MPCTRRQYRSSLHQEDFSALLAMRRSISSSSAQRTRDGAVLLDVEQTAGLVAGRSARNSVHLHLATCMYVRLRQRCMPMRFEEPCSNRRRIRDGESAMELARE